MTPKEFKQLLEIAEKEDLLPDSVDGLILDSNPEVYKDFSYDVQLKAILSCEDDIDVIPILNEMGNDICIWACEE